MNTRKKLLNIGCDFFLIISFLTNSAHTNISEKYVVEVPVGMVYVEEGMSTIGAKDGDLDAKSDAKPIHEVFLKSYYMDILEVTNEAYSDCVQAGKCDEPQETSSATRENYYGNVSYNRYPVVNVTWEDAENYCEFVGKRLPSEAEWEKAGMGTSGYRRYPWGNGSPESYTLNITQIPGDTEMGNTYWKGQSPYGLVDVVGNVSEWVSDWYSESYYQESVVENPSGPANGTKKVIRGDSWSSDIEKIHITNRYAMEPDQYNNETGFRCAMDVKERIYYNTPEPAPTEETETRYAVVNSGHDGGIFLLQEPGVNKAIVCVAPQGSMLEILEGPVEINFSKWYHVRTSTGWVGWTIESSLTMMK